MSPISPPIRVLVVDDNPRVIEVFAAAIRNRSDLALAASASGGQKAIDLAQLHRPDVVAMDVNMPGMTGMHAVEALMGVAPTPTLMMTEASGEEFTDMTFTALRRGALGLAQKPRNPVELSSFLDRLVSIAGVAVAHGPRPSNQQSERGPSHFAAAYRGKTTADSPAIVGIVASTGGPLALREILSLLPPDFSVPILIVQHIVPGFESAFPEWLNSVSRIAVTQARHGAALVGGQALIAPSHGHLLAGECGSVVIDEETPALEGHRPSGNLLLESLARHYGGRALGVVLTGMGDDGVRGLMRIKERGGITIAQDGASCAVDGMPKAARDRGAAGLVLGLQDIAACLSEFVRGAAYR